MAKATRASEVKNFVDIPNVGKAMERNFLLLGLKSPADLKNQDPYKLYQKMCKVSVVRQDPCVLDTYLAVVDFMNGAAIRPWWSYTTERKEKFPFI